MSVDSMSTGNTDSMVKQEKDGMKLMRFMLMTVALSSMSVMMFNIVIPEISVDLGLSLTQVSWLSSGYILIYAFGTVTYGKLADRFQLRNVLTLGLLLFAFGSLVGLFSSSFWGALVGRLMQAAGASVVPALAMIIPVRYFSQERRGSAMSMTAIGLALGSVLAPAVSALILSVADWRWLFVPPMLLLLLLPYYRKYLLLPATGVQGKFDWLGAVLLLGAMALLLLGITYGLWLLILLGTLLLPVFYVWIRVAKNPFIHPGLFQNTSYRTGIILTILIATMANGLFYLSPVMLADVYSINSQWIGYALIPAAIASALLGRRGGILADSKGNTTLYTVAAGLLTTCFILLAVLVDVVSVWLIPLLFIFGNVGQTFMQVSVANTVSMTLSKEQVGVGMGFFSMMNFITMGMTIGIYSRLAEWDVRGWNSFLTTSETGMFNNIYLVLALMHVIVLLFYRVSFGTKK
ncbi:MFS transporter [Bacillus horti]|uniref:DHA2 family metal-tetracycline-proton antiporter-like MFS transporter n=1 Tax=Caldalkalibacillus horti TaxID=77523 RepID=A0ABT9VXH4_9BACI|nr:MFS transporter [Bacillus horti]MDQ0165687.1 DHA2 family metal-tetracycline-proton antiporter-like MFS transporter [Bacillus horti]